MDARRRPWVIGLGGSVMLVAVLLAVSSVSSAEEGSARGVAERWVEVQDGRLEDCEVLELYSGGYLEEHGFSRGRCEEDPAAFFSHWFMESETAGSHYELVDVHERGKTAVAEVEEHGGVVPHLRLFLVSESGDWRIEAVGASLPEEG